MLCTVAGWLGLVRQMWASPPEGKALQATSGSPKPHRGVKTTLWVAGAFVIGFVILVVPRRLHSRITYDSLSRCHGNSHFVRVGIAMIAVAVMIRMFEEGNILLLILSFLFCGLGPFVIGWLKSNEYDIRHLMWVWSICLITNVLMELLLAVLLLLLALAAS